MRHIIATMVLIAAFGLPARAQSPVSFTLAVDGTHHVTVGHYMFASVNGTVTSGTDQQATPSISGLPAGVTATWPDLATFCCGAQMWRISGAPQALRIEASTSAAPGTYPLTITYTAAGGNASIPFDLVVDPIPAPITPQQFATPPPLSGLAQWQANMTTVGNQHCNASDAAWVPSSNDWYYDGVWVYNRIGAYTGNAAVWQACADMVAGPYQTYILGETTPGGVFYGPGYNVWSKGLAINFLRTNNAQTKQAVAALSNGTYSQYANAALLSAQSMVSWYTSRETALAIGSQYAYQMVGGSLGPKFQDLIELAIGQMNQWFVDKNTPYVQGFMVGLTCEQLINYYQVSKDPRIPFLLKAAADGLMATWDPTSQSWLANQGDATTSGPAVPAVDLNLLIVPIYGYVWQLTGDPKYLSEGDAAFNAGVAGAWLGQAGIGGKQFMQNYHWSFDYVAWRQSLTTAPPPPPAAKPCGPSLTLTNGVVSWPAGSCPTQ